MKRLRSEASRWFTAPSWQGINKMEGRSRGERGRGGVAGEEGGEGHGGGGGRAHPVVQRSANLSDATATREEGAGSFKHAAQNLMRLTRRFSPRLVAKPLRTTCESLS